MELRVARRYRVGPKIGSGNHGEIFGGVDVTTGAEVAIKIEPLKSKDPQILHENDMYKILGQGGNQTTPY